MPLSKKISRKAISENIRTELRSGTLTAKTPEMRRKQAIAIALSTARRSARKRGQRLPAYLQRKSSRRRRAARHRSTR